MAMAIPTAARMLFHSLYFFVDLYFVAGLGDAAVAGVSAAGNVMFIILALTQALAVGTVALFSHAVGRKDLQDANLIFNQSLLIAAALGALAMVLGYTFIVPYLQFVTADQATMALGREYLFWLLPGIALEFAMVSMGSVLIGAGIVKPGMIVQGATVLINIAMAPVLITGWGTGYAMGVAGAGLASSISVLIGVVLLRMYFIRLEYYASFQRGQCQPRFDVWRRILMIGLPAGGELVLIFAYTSITLWAISGFGPAAQAGFGIGSRILNGICLPALAIAAVVAPVAGQNYGARRMARVRETFRAAFVQSMILMLVAMLLCQWQPETLVSIFSHEPEVVRIAAVFLELVSWNFVLGAVIFVCSGIFQAFGNTLPSLLSSAMRLIVYAMPTIWLTSQPTYNLEHVWYLSIASAIVQAVISLTLLRQQLRRRLGSPALSASV